MQIERIVFNILLSLSIVTRGSSIVVSSKKKRLVVGALFCRRDYFDHRSNVHVCLSLSLFSRDMTTDPSLSVTSMFDLLLFVHLRCRFLHRESLNRVAPTASKRKRAEAFAHTPLLIHLSTSKIRLSALASTPNSTRNQKTSFIHCSTWSGVFEHERSCLCRSATFASSSFLP